MTYKRFKEIWDKEVEVEPTYFVGNKNTFKFLIDKANREILKEKLTDLVS